MQPLTAPELWVGGQPLTGRIWWGDLTITHRWPYGCWEVQWGMTLKPYQRLPGVAADALVEVKMGASSLWSGNLAEPDWSSDTFTAVGAVRQGETSLCFTSGGETTSVPDTAIDQAISRGAVDWTRLASLSSSAFASGDSTPNLNYLTALMDAWSSANGKRWGVDAYRRVYADVDPVAPTVYVRPGAGVLGVTNQAQVGRIFGRYINGSGTYSTVNVGAGRPEVGVFLGKRGVLDSTKATEIITGIRDQLQATTGWTNGLTLTRDMVTNRGGQTRPLDWILAGRRARIRGLRDERGAEASTDIVLGETIWNVSAGTVQANPVGMVGNDLSSVVEDNGGELL